MTKYPLRFVCNICGFNSEIVQNEPITLVCRSCGSDVLSFTENVDLVQVQADGEFGEIKRVKKAKKFSSAYRTQTLVGVENRRIWAIVGDESILGEEADDAFIPMIEEPEESSTEAKRKELKTVLKKRKDG